MGFLLAMLGLIFAALLTRRFGLLFLLLPLGRAFWRARSTSARPNNMSRAAALAVLELDENATRADIERAYRRLMRRHHPDKPCGSEAMARRLNAARDYLLKD